MFSSCLYLHRGGNLGQCFSPFEQGWKESFHPCSTFFPERGSVGSLMHSDRHAVGAPRRRVCSPLACAVVSWYMCPARAQGEGPEEGMALFSLFFPFNCGLTLGLLYRTSPQGMGDRGPSQAVQMTSLSAGQGSRRGWELIKIMAEFSLGKQGFLFVFLFPSVRPWSFFF